MVFIDTAGLREARMKSKAKAFAAAGNARNAEFILHVLDNSKR